MREMPLGFVAEAPLIFDDGVSSEKHLSISRPIQEHLVQKLHELLSSPCAACRVPCHVGFLGEQGSVLTQGKNVFLPAKPSLCQNQKVLGRFNSGETNETLVLTIARLSTVRLHRLCVHHHYL